jgi:hypothetical protein
LDELTVAEALRRLELPDDATLLQVERAFHRKRALYAEGALATYCLFEDGGREALLASLEVAYRTAAARREASQPPIVTAGDLPPGVDPATSPGRYLAARRQAAGLALRDVASRTKISPMQLQQIEEERYALLPAPVYLRGFVVAYARALGLPDADLLAGHFLARQREANGE